MNFKDYLCLNQDLLSSITLYPLQFGNFYIFVISNDLSFISQILRVGLLELFSSLRFKTQSNFDQRTNGPPSPSLAEYKLLFTSFSNACEHTDLILSCSYGVIQ